MGWSVVLMNSQVPLDKWLFPSSFIFACACLYTHSPWTPCRLLSTQGQYWDSQRHGNPCWFCSLHHRVMLGQYLGHYPPSVSCSTWTKWMSRTLPALDFYFSTCLTISILFWKKGAEALTHFKSQRDSFSYKQRADGHMGGVWKSGHSHDWTGPLQEAQDCWLGATECL